MVRDGIPGLAVAIISRGSVRFVRAYGDAAAGRPMRNDTPIAAGSLMKGITAACVLQLVDAGRIELDQPAQRYLPEFRLARSADAVDTAAIITVRQLLTHTSGLADNGFAEMRLPQPTSITGRVTSLSAARPASVPGQTFHYFNPNYDLLARIVEVRSGMPFQDYVERFVFTPLGMRSSVVRPTMQALRGAMPVSGQALAQGHVEAFGQAVALDEGEGFLGGAGGLVTTADDLGRWLAFQARDGQEGGMRVLSPAGMALLRTPAPAQPYAMGWFSLPVGGRQALFHNGILSTFYAEMTLFPDTGDGFVILANVNGFLPVRSAFPRLRAGLAAFTSTQTPLPAGVDARWLGASLFVAWLLAIGAALFDIWRGFQGSATPTRWRTAAGIALRLIPLAGLLMVPWTVEHFSGRAFSLRALGLAMIDILAGWALLAATLAAAGAVRVYQSLRRA